MSQRHTRQEIELKLDVDDLDAVAQWIDRHYPPAAGEPGWRVAPLTDHYFDTAHGALALAGYGARLRRSRRHTQVGLKRDLDVRGALHRRLELEAPATRSLRPLDWPPSEARDVVLEQSAGARLVERFAIEQRRRERRGRLADAAVLFSIDDATVLLAGTPVGVIRQLEVELLEGDPAELATLARALAGSALFRRAAGNKMSVAAKLAHAGAPLAVDDAWDVAARKTLRRHLLRLIEREPQARAGEPLAIKQARVATRRLRATWRLFGDAFRRSARRRHVDPLRELGRRLGAVRDLDVLLAGLPSDPALAPLVAAWRTQRAAAHAELLAHLGSEGHDAAIDALLALTQTAGAGNRRRVAQASVARRGPAALGEAYTRVLDAGERLAQVPLEAPARDEALHALRIESRRLRYAIEALRDVLPRPQAARLLARLVALQDHLGALNDAVLVAAAIDEWLARDGAGAPLATRTAAADHRARRLAEADALRHGFRARWRRISEPAFRRMLERPWPDVAGAATELTGR